MANERLRASIHSAGLTVQELSEKIQVDPKTIGRWITKDRLPHRMNREEVARALNCDETHLWPTAITAIDAVASAESELVRVYPSRGAIPSTTWGDLIDNAERSISVLVFAGSFLHDTVEDFTQILVRKGGSEVSVRLAIGDPDCSAVEIRGREEGIGASLAERCRLTWKYLEPLTDAPGIRIRAHKSTLYSSMFQFDDEWLINTHIAGLPASQAPVFHFSKRPQTALTNSIAKKFETAFEKVWLEGDAMKSNLQTPQIHTPQSGTSGP